MITHYKELKIWQRSFALANRVYVVTEEFPKHQLYALTQQIQRCAVSVPSNIAEGNNRSSTKEYLHFLNISLGSLAELETQLLIAQQQRFISQENAGELLSESDEIGKMIRAIRTKLAERVAA